MANTITTGKQTANFNISNIIGVDIGGNYPVYAIPGSAATQTNLYYPETSNPPFALGTHVLGTNNSEYVLCVVGTAGSINQYDLVMIDANYNIVQASSTSGAPSVGALMAGFNQGPGVAASQASVTVNFCWIAIRGNQLNVNTTAAIGAALPLAVGTAPGTINAFASGTGTTFAIGGVTNPASVTAATVMAVIAAYPVLLGPVVE